MRKYIIVLLVSIVVYSCYTKEYYPSGKLKYKYNLKK